MEGVLLKGWLAFLAVFFASTVALAVEGETSISDLRTQAELYEKRGRLGQARKTLVKAYGLPGGREDFGVVFLFFYCF